MMIPVIAGWGKDAKPIAYLGIIKCQNCKNYEHFHLYEIAKKASAFFVRVAKWGKKYYVVCGLCEASVEVSQSEKDEIIQESLSLPDMNTANEIWSAIDGIVLESHKAGTFNDAGADTLGKAIDQLEEQYPESAVDYVRAVYVESLQDPDTPE